MPLEIHTKMLTTAEAAKLLNVSSPTIVNWIEKDAIPYVQLPSAGGKRREFRIPLKGLMDSLQGNYDITGEVEGGGIVEVEEKPD